MLSRNEVLFLELEEAQPSLALTPESLRASSPLGRGAGAAQLPPSPVPVSSSDGGSMA